MLCRLTVLVILLGFSLHSWAAIIIGNPTGKVTLVEVFDYQCPHCHEANAAIESLIVHNPDLKVRLLPTAVLNKTSLYEAAASIAATYYPGRFQQFHALVMSQAPLSPKGVHDLLTDIGLSGDKFNHLLHSPQTLAQLKESEPYLKQSHGSVPFFVIYPSNHPAKRLNITGFKNAAILQTAIKVARTHE